MMISVVIPTFKRPRTLDATLGALLASDLPQSEYEVIVVDDAGDRETEQAVAAHGRTGIEVFYVANPGRGAAAARNAGLGRARGDVVLFLDDDMRVRPDHLRRHLDTRSRHSNALIGGTRWYSPESLAALEASPFGRYRVALEHTYAENRAEVLDGDAVTEAATLASYDLSMCRASCLALKGFDENFPFAGAEDQDFSTRAARAGHELIRDNAIRLLHDDPTTTLRQFGLREERGAHTVASLARKYPEMLGEFYRNDPIAPDDPTWLIAQKLCKELLSLTLPLELLHRLATLLERTGATDRQLWRLYRIVIGLHMFRGYRDALRLGSVDREMRA